MQTDNGRDRILAFRCPPSLYQAVLQLAKETERTASQVGRLAVLQFIERSRKQNRT